MGRSQRSKNKQKNMRFAKKNSFEYQEKARLKLQNKVNNKMEKKYLVGIYDSFRKNGKYNYKINTANSKFIGSYSTQPIYNMYDLGVDDVVIVKEGDLSIKIEIWEISEKVLAILEKEYSYYVDLGNQNIYLRETVSSPFGDILLYIYDDVYNETDIIILGDWIEHLNILKVKKPIIDSTINYVKNGYNKIMNSSKFALDEKLVN